MPTDSNGYPPSSLLHSCEEIKTQYPNSPSDNNQWYRTSTCSSIISTVRWDRFVVVVEWPTSTYWTQLRSIPVDSDCNSQNGVRACGRPVTSVGSCQSICFPSYNISYSQVCGRVYGYQHRSPDTFLPVVNNNINSYFVDGIVLPTEIYESMHI